MIQHHTHVKPVLASALVGGAKLPHLHLRTCEFHAGTREICAVAREFCAGACELCAVACELCAGTRELCAGARELCAGAREFCASAGEFCAARSKIYLDLPWFLGRCCANSWADLRSSFSSFHVHAPLSACCPQMCTCMNLFQRAGFCGCTRFHAIGAYWCYPVVIYSLWIGGYI